MEVVQKRVAMLTNCEVLEFLKSQKKDEKSSEKLKMLNTVVWETRKYLQASPAATQNSDMIEQLLPKLKPFKLTTAETLQIINLRPSAPADIQLLVEETEERFPAEEELQNLVDAVTSTLPPPPPKR
ncbi:unnamed protein product [Caenorhabditis angaria]|uniref:DNA-directed RNA polymerase III subunit RPC9 n=1 Tax=Caenorhabditis angaria TaxID=860376 RepID=A0A9P1MYP0_9PELO|nr:unnamed protein product [Caenorhabditis angaria]